MLDDPRALTFIGTTDFRNQNVKFGIRARDRLRHTYIIGSTGVGKSWLIENLVIQDILNGNGVALIDPHGSSAEKILQYIPEHRINDVIYFAPHDLENPIGFNPLEDPGPDLRSQISDGLLTAFKKIWVDAFSARMEYVLSNTLLALLEYPDATLLSVNRMLSDKKFREKVVANVKDPSVRSTWVDEFMKWEDKFAREAFAAIQNKVGQFTANPMIRNILGQPRSTLDFRDMMDTRKIFIANLSKGRVGEQNAPLIGAMLITKIYLAAMSRADKTEYEMNFLPPFYMFVDEFQNFANDSFENILSESRKYKLGLTVAHQYIDQMPEKIRAAVFGNVGTKIAFRTQKPEDAEVLEKAFAPVFTQTDIMNLSLAQIYLTLLIDGVGSAPFSARTLLLPPKPSVTFYNEVIAASRSRYTRPRAEVEAEISQWFGADTAHQQGYYQQQSPQSNNTQAQRPLSPAQQSYSRSASPEQRNSMPREELHQHSALNTSQSESRTNNKPADYSESTEVRQQTKKDAEHAVFLEQRRKEIESKGGVWLSPEEHRAAKEAGNLNEVMNQKRIEMRERQQAEAAQSRRSNDSNERSPQRTMTPMQRPERPVQPRPQPDIHRDFDRNAPNTQDSRNERKSELRKPETIAPKKNEATDDTRNSLRDLLAGLQKDPEVTRVDELQKQSKPAEVGRDKMVLAARPARQDSVDTSQIFQQANPYVLTKKAESAIYAHEIAEPVRTSDPSSSSPVPTPTQQTGHIGWNEISPADLARALGVRL